MTASYKQKKKGEFSFDFVCCRLPLIFYVDCERDVKTKERHGRAIVSSLFYV